MADDRPGAAKGAAPPGSGKRPYATLDLKATEVTAAPAPATAGISPQDVPLPAPAWSYAETESAGMRSQDESKMASSRLKRERGAGMDMPAEPAEKAAPKSGGFLSHLAAGVIGGAIVLAASLWALPELEPHDATPSDGGPLVAERLAALEKSVRGAQSPDLASIDARLAELEKTAQTIPALTESQSRLVADTKAALAGAASNVGSLQLIERLGTVEDKLKALADAGANDPNAGRIEQLAALTGEIADLKSSLPAQLAALRASVTGDVDARIHSATEAGETARAGTQRLDADVASLKNGTAALEQGLASAKAASDGAAAALKLAEGDVAELKAAFDALKSSAAKPADITAAIAPLSDRIAALEKNVEAVVEADKARKTSTEQVVLALELQNLRRALDSGQKFSSELQAVKKIAGDRVDLSSLEKLQDSGLPSLADLTKDFRAAADAAIDTDSDAAGTGVVDRLWAGAKSVVRVRRIDLKPEDKSTEAIVGRMQVALADGRLPDVLEAAKDLSPNAQAAAQPFLDKVAARVGVDDAIARLEAQLKSALVPGAEPAAAEHSQ